MLPTQGTLHFSIADSCARNHYPTPASNPPVLGRRTIGQNRRCTQVVSCLPRASPSVTWRRGCLLPGGFIRSIGRYLRGSMMGNTPHALHRLNKLPADHARRVWFEKNGFPPLRLEVSLAFFNAEHRRLLGPAAPSVESRMETIQFHACERANQQGDSRSSLLSLADQGNSPDDSPPGQSVRLVGEYSDGHTLFMEKTPFSTVIGRRRHDLNAHQGGRKAPRHPGVVVGSLRGTATPLA